MMRRFRSAIASSGDEDGFTIIEVLVAAFVLVLGALAVFIGFAGAIHGIQRGREMQQGVSVAQREMERIRVEPFEQIGIVSGSVAGTPPDETKVPTSRVGAGGTTFEMKRSGGESKRFVSGDLPNTPVERRSDDGTNVQVYRFVVCEIEASPCPRKRIVVDVLPIAADNQNGYRHSYYELQSTVVEPG
jgi:Tfp pilus assembly protein PilV